MKIILIIIVFIIIILIGSLLFIYSGVYNVAATKPHTRLIKWIMHTTMERSVKFHAKGIKPPKSLDESLVQAGFNHYNEMCEGCHGAPGVKPSEIGKGLYPEPPDLAKSSGEISPAELYWIIKHGIKDTGMPAFGLTHSENELWAIVAFLRRLPELSPKEYQAMEEKAKSEQHEHNHGHNHGEETSSGAE